MKKQRLLNLKKGLTFSLIIIAMQLCYNSTHAQTINSYTNSTYLTADYICPACTSATALECINVDMMQPKPDGTYTDLIQTYVFSGGVGYDMTTSTTLIDQSRIMITYTGTANPKIDKELPMPNTGLWQANQTTPGSYIVHDPDVALGHTFDLTTGADIWFATVVYESNGEIYMEAWQFDPYTLTFTGSLIPVTATVGGIYSGGQIQISNANGNAKYPRLDLFVDKADPTNPFENSTDYVVTWEENGTVMTAEGPLFSAPSTTATIGSGSRPDVAGISNHKFLASGSSYDDNMVYVTYVDASDDLMLAERKFNDPTIINTILLATSATNTFHYPRIAGSRFFDFSTTVPNDPVCVVVASEYVPGSNYYTVNSYTYDEPLNNPGNVTPKSVSDYTGHGLFTTNPNNCIMPVVTGTGMYTRDKYASHAVSPAPGPQQEFSVIFYSDYTWNNGAYVPSGNGDLYNSNIDMSTYAPVNTDYQEVFGNNSYSLWSLPGNRPLFDVASSNNSNYDLYVAYYDGEYIYSKYTGSNTYSFKPTSINSVANSEIAVYPNPVTTELTIGDAAGAQYTVTSITGSVVAAGTISGNSHKISTANYAAGTYILQVMNDGVPSTVKFVKQ